MEKRVLVINYHKIDTGQPFSSPIDKLFAVTKDSFEEQMNILRKHGISLVTLNDLVSDTLSNAFSVAITVDDENASDYTVVYPLLKAKSMTATFFWFGNDKENIVDWEHAKEMIKSGFTIGSHGISHSDLTKMTPKELPYELEGSKKQLEEKIGCTVRYFALPYGLYNSRILAAAEYAGYTAICTTDIKLNSSEKSFLIHRWNVKRNTSLKEFEEMVCNKNRLKYKIKKDLIKKTTQRILGKKMTSGLNVLFNT